MNETAQSFAYYFVKDNGDAGGLLLCESEIRQVYGRLEDNFEAKIVFNMTKEEMVAAREAEVDRYMGVDDVDMTEENGIDETSSDNDYDPEEVKMGRGGD